MLDFGLTIKTVEQLSSERKEPFWIRDKRMQSFEKFNELPVPVSDKLSNIFLIDFSKIQFEENKGEVFASSDNKIAFEDLSIAIKKYPDLIRKKLMTDCINAFESKLTALHYAFWNEGAFLYIPKDTDAGIINLVTGMNSKTKFENVLIIAEEGAKATIIEKSFSGNNEGYRSQIVELFLGDRAMITYSSFQDLSKKVVNMNMKRAILEKDAVMRWIDCNSGGSFTISDVSTVHAGRGSNSKTFGIFFGEESQRFEFSVNSFHKAPSTESRMVMKGMLKGKAKSLYNGLIDIDEKGAGTIGYQREDVLLLGEGAEANAIPKLQIKNNDVKCSHGTAVGQLDQDKIFYLMSRGLSAEEAQKIVVDGFFEPLLKEMKAETVVENVREILMRKNAWSN